MRAPLAALIVVLAALLGGIWLGGHSSTLPGPLADFARDDDLAVVDAAIERVHDDYYKDVGKDKLADEAIRGMVEGLDDRFSSYFDPGQYAKFREVTDAEFSGIGVSVQPTEAGLRIVEVYDGAPADKAKLRKGDVIVAADGKRLADVPEEAATGLIKGREGTKVKLTLRRGDERIERSVTRAKVSIPVVESSIEKRDGRRVGVVSLAQFSSGAHAEVYDAVRRAMERDVSGLVFDLRGNTGGLVEEARLVASGFLPDGEIVTTRGRSVRTRVYRATGSPVAAKIPMVVLVDEGSASASEIVAGALQDRKRAKLVGTATYGKGVFQQVIPLDNGGALDFTVGQYFLPSGRNIGGRGIARGKGLKPDVTVEDKQGTERDEALERAIDVLGSR
jgi:carboxyl-terminal processing protease